MTLHQLRSQEYCSSKYYYGFIIYVRNISNMHNKNKTQMMASNLRKTKTKTKVVDTSGPEVSSFHKLVALGAGVASQPSIPVPKNPSIQPDLCPPLRHPPPKPEITLANKHNSQNSKNPSAMQNQNRNPKPHSNPCLSFL